MQLILLHPKVAFRKCEHCLVYSYDEETGAVDLGRDDKPRKRLPLLPAPCRDERGCVKGTPEKPRTLSEKNQLAWQHYCECRAVGQFPDDPWVKKNARIIRDVEDGVREVREIEFRQTLLTLATLAARPTGG